MVMRWATLRGGSRPLPVSSSLQLSSLVARQYSASGNARPWHVRLTVNGILCGRVFAQRGGSNESDAAVDVQAISFDDDRYI